MVLQLPLGCCWKLTVVQVSSPPGSGAAMTRMRGRMCPVSGTAPS